MRRLLLGFLGMPLLACAAETPPADEPHPERDAVLAAAQAVFDILETRDTAALRSLMLPTGAFVGTQGAQVSASNVDQMAAALGRGGQAFLERMWDPEVRIEGAIATVWTPYDFYRDGVFSHCGIDSFQLVKQPEGWRVASVIYTRQTEGCPESPLGPPSG